MKLVIAISAALAAMAVAQVAEETTITGSDGSLRGNYARWRFPRLVFNFIRRTTQPVRKVTVRVDTRSSVGYIRRARFSSSVC